MKPNLNRFAAILLFTCVAITCSLTMWATPAVQTVPDTSKTPATGTSIGLTRAWPAAIPLCWNNRYPQSLRRLTYSSLEHRHTCRSALRLGRSYIQV